MTKNLLMPMRGPGLYAAYVLIACAAFLFAVFAPLPAEADNPPLFTNKYTRTIGKPNVFSEKFKSCNTGATYKMVIENGDAAGKNRIRSASITLNGNEVVKESDFNQKTGRIEKNVSLVEANTLEVKLSSGTGGTLNISIFCIANCLEVKIIEPKDGSSLDTHFIVKGEVYNVQGMVDVKVDSGTGNQYRAYRSGNTFGIATLFGTDGKGDIVSESTVIATSIDACGYKAIDSVHVKHQPVKPYKIRLDVNPKQGVINKKSGVLKVSIGELYGKSMGSNFEWDIEGDGVVDVSGEGLDGITHEYALPGIYFVRSKQTVYRSGNVYVGEGVVVVRTEEELDAEVKPVWNGLKNALANSDVEGALAFIAPYGKAKYRKLYERMKSIGTMPRAAADMGEPYFKRSSDDTAIYLVTKKQMFKGKEEEITFEIRFERNRDTGLWEIVQY